MAHRNGTRRIPDLVLAAVVTLAVLTLLLYAGASRSLNPAAAATLTTTAPGTTAPPTTTSAPGTTASGTSGTTQSTTSAADCTLVAPTGGLVTAAATSLLLTVTSPGGYQCGTLRTTTVALYADAGHTSLVTSQVLAAGTTKSAVRLSGLSPSTDYYPVLSLTAPGTPSTSLPATRTTATAPTTTTTTGFCNWERPATVTPVSSTSSTITYTYVYDDAYQACSGLRSVHVALFTNAERTQVFGTWDTPTGASTGAFQVTGLSPSTTYWGTWRTGSSQVSTMGDVDGFSTQWLVTTTDSGSGGYDCPPKPLLLGPGYIRSDGFTWALPERYCWTQLTATVYTSLADAQAMTNEVPHGSVWRATVFGVYGLQQDTDYWVRFSGDGGMQGPLHTQRNWTTTTTTTTGTTTTEACDPTPATAQFIGATTSSLTFSFSSPAAASCDRMGVTSITLYRDAAHTQAEAVASSEMRATSGVLTVIGLAPGTTYWPLVQLWGSPSTSPVMPSVSTLPFGTVTSTTTRTTTTRPTVVCDPAFPTAQFTAATISSLSFSFSSLGAVGCNGTGTTTITVYRDAAHTAVAGSASSAAGATSGTLTVTGLAPGTTYWPTVRLSNAPIGPDTMPSASTLPFGTVTTTTTSRPTTTTISQRSCTATWNTLSAWPGGFLGQITVKNTSSTASSSWTVGWTWSGTARLTASYHATVGGTAVSPTLTALDWNRVIQGGSSTVVQVQGTLNGPLTVPAISCTLT